MYFYIIFLKLTFMLNSVNTKLNFNYCNNFDNVTSFSQEYQLKLRCHSLLESKLPNKNYSNQAKNEKSSFDFWKICRETLAEGYTDQVSIIQLENDYLDPKDVYSNLGFVTLFTELTDLHLSIRVIIIVRSTDKFHKLLHIKNLWNQERIFVIVILECSADIKSEMESLWNSQKIYRYVLLCIYEKPLMYIYRPYLLDNRSKISEITDTSEIVHNMHHAIDNLYGLPLRVVLFPLIPYVIERNGNYVGGVDYNALEVLQERMNFSPVIYPPTDGNTFPQPNKKLSGSVKDLADGRADIAFNGHFLQHYGINEVKMSRYVYMDKLCFVVAVPSLKSHYSVIIHIFSKRIWILLILVYFVTVITYHMTRKLSEAKKHNQTIIDLFLPTYSILVLGSSTLKTTLSSQKLLIGTVLLGFLIINNTFQGCLTPALSRPGRDPFIDSIDQITKTELALESEHAETLVTDPEILQLLNTLRKRKATTTNFIRLGRFPITQFEKYYIFLSYRSDKNITENLHTVQECIKSNYLSFVVPKNSPLLRRVNAYVLRFQESGLLTKWFGGSNNLMLKNIFWPSEDELTMEIQPRKFSVKDLAAIFYILVFGLATGIAVFLIECVAGYRRVLTKNVPF